MTIEFDPLARDPLARRLEAIDIAVPPMPPLAAGRRELAGRALGRASALPFRRRAARRPVLVAAFAIATMLVATAAVNGDAIVRLTQDALKAAGLASGEVSGLHGTGEAAGAKATVDGGYADNIATVLFVAFDLPCRSGPCVVTFPGTTYAPPVSPDEGLLRPDPSTLPYVVDQYGRRYFGSIGGVGVGAYPSFFEPLSGRALAGANLTLHVPIQTPSGRTEVVVQISGTLKPRGAKSIDAGPAMTRNGVTYQVVKAQYSGSYLEVHTRLTGELGSVITKYVDGGEEWPGVFLVDSRGAWSVPLTGVGFPTVNRQVQDETRIFAARPGVYDIVVAKNDGDRNAAPGSSWTTLAAWTVNTA